MQKVENLERLLLTQKLLKAKMYDDLEDVVDRLVIETSSVKIEPQQNQQEK